VFADVPNDLVVPTEGCYVVPGPAGHRIEDHLVFDASAAVDHNGYWGRPSFADHLLRWLDAGSAGNDPAMPVVED
jgi:hypothetical protein